MTCPTCASENIAGAKFCNECGTPLAAGCPSCGATNRPGAKFCSECGMPLSEDPEPSLVAPGTQSGPIAERRLVTVLFADMVGFTPFAEERDAEDVRETLSHYFELCAQVIGRYGGTVEKYIGDAVMAVWGAPVAHEDDAERAVRAALDLVDSVTTLAPDIRARAGVLTGEAAVTLNAVNQGLVAGDLVNTAARLQSVADAGTVLVGETTMRASVNAIVYEQAGDHSLKGKQAPVATWRALRVIAEVGGRNRSDALEAPFVGRGDELRLLKDLFHATGREQKVRLVSVMGPAGIGKSRLAWEFLKYVDGVVETTYWHSGRSPAYGEGISFWALGEMVRGRCGLTESEDEATTRSKVADAVGQWVPDEAERSWVNQALLTLLGIDSGMAPDELFAAWRTFFERVSAHGTVTLVFEDTHFADSGLLDFIEHMLEWSRGHPIYVVTLARPELLERRPDWGAGTRSFTSIYLEPLTDEQMRQLLSGLVPGLPAAATDAIVERADGIPLYAVETVRMLVADGRLVQREGAYDPVGDLAALAVPETLTALIASRLDALDPVDRALVQDAAVLGQTFTLSALAAVSGLVEGELETRTMGLVRRELFTRSGDQRSPERGQLAFMQALIREVAYNTLARRDRKGRHLAAARHFEQIESDELAGALANHYLAAMRNATEGPEADALAAQARLALRGAAERASALGAHDQAIVFADQALEVASDPADRAELLFRAGESARRSGRIDVMRGRLTDAIKLNVERGDRLAAARAVNELGLGLANGRRDQEVAELLAEEWPRYADLWPDPVTVDLKLLLARSRAQAGDFAGALVLVDEALTQAERADELRRVAVGLEVKGMVLSSMSRVREGLALLGGAERLARELSELDLLSSVLLLGGFFLNEIDARAALVKFEEGFELARRRGVRPLMLVLSNNIAYTAFLSGEWERGLEVATVAMAEVLDRGHRLWLLGNATSIRAARGEDVTDATRELMELRRPDDPYDLHVPVLDALGTVGLANGDLEEAFKHWRLIADLPNADPAQKPSSYYQAARPALWLGDVDRAARQLVDLDATGFRGPIVEARRLTILAGMARLEGRAAEAEGLYRRAIKAWHDLGMLWDEAMTGLDQALLTPAGEIDRDVVAEARGRLIALGATPFVERLDEHLGAAALAVSADGAYPVRAEASRKT